MAKEDEQLDAELKRVLWAAVATWMDETAVPKSERSICYSWVIDRYRRRFSASFHQSKLQRLEQLGFLRKLDSARGGSRRYYAIIDPDAVSAMLEQWGFSYR